MAGMQKRLLTIFKRLEHMDALFKKNDECVDEIEKQALITGQKTLSQNACFGWSLQVPLVWHLYS